MFPGPGAVTVQDMIQCLRGTSESRSRDCSDEPCVKRLRSEEVQGATHAAKHSELETTEEAKTLESRVFPLQRVVFVDSTWNQTNKIVTDERLQGNRKCPQLYRFSQYVDKVF